MIDRFHTVKILLPIAAMLLLTGCQSGPWAKPQEPVDPALPMTMLRDELVDYLNQQSGNLHSWQSSQVRMKVRMPRMVPVTLTGSMACESPNHFRLNTDNTLMHADLGANAERCWVYIKPGADGVISWRHEDAHLLEQLPTGVPYIDPDWLMEVLGVTPLERERFVIGAGPLPNSRELWLASSERTPTGRVLRRVIKVDTVRGVICEHAVYNEDDRVVVRAELSDHQPFNSHLIPRKVVLSFPSMDTELTLTFSRIETNPQIASNMWQVPSVAGAGNIDVGELVAGYEEERRRRDQNSAGRDSGSQDDEVRTAATLPEPDWDTPSMEPDWDSPRQDSRKIDNVRTVGDKNRSGGRAGWFPRLW